MQNSKLKKTGNSRPKTDKTPASSHMTSKLFAETEKECLAEAKTRVPTDTIDVSTDQLDFLEVFQTIESILRSLKTFNVNDTCGLRETEKRKILEMIHNNFTADADVPVINSTMIIFGQPGLGKTLLVLEVFGHLQKEHMRYLSRELGKKNEAIPSGELVCIYMNAMNFANCFDFIDEFLAAVDEKVQFFKKTEKKKSNSIVKIEIFMSKLTQILSTHKFVVLIDELETLSQNDKGNFHHLMQILNLKRSGFVNICISNTLNLFSSLNGNSLYLNFEYLIFKPYSEQNLLNILCSRMKKDKTPINFEFFLSVQALNFIVKKAFKNTSSDVRFILTITQTIVENKQTKIAEMQRQKLKLTAKDISICFPEILHVFNEKLCGDWSNIIQKLNFQTQILLLVLWQTIDPVNQTVKLVNLLGSFGVEFPDDEAFVWFGQIRFVQEFVGSPERLQLYPDE